MSFILQRALTAHQKGDLIQAEQLYKEQLVRNPTDTNALQLLGTLYASQGRLEQAIELMLKSLAVNNTQMPVHANLAICYKRLGLLDLAQKQYQMMIELDGNNPEAYKSLIRLLIEQKEYVAARRILDQAILNFEDNFAFLLLDAEISRHMSKFSDALTKYTDLLAKHPEQLELLHDYALTLRLSGDPTSALHHYTSLQSQGLNGFQLFHNMANAFSDLGNLEEAIASYRKAISLNPGYVPSHVNLNELLWEIGNKQDFLQSFHQAFLLDANNLELKYSYCQFLLRLTKYQECIDFLSSISKSTDKSANYYTLFGKAHLRLGLNTDGIKYLKMASKLKDADTEVKIELAQALIETRAIKEAEQVLKEVLDDTPDHQLALALRGVCWRLLDDPREAQLNDYENLVKEYQIEVPAGFASTQDFCHKLNEYLEKLHTGIQQPLEQTLTGGTQTRGNLFDHKESIIQDLIDSLKKAIRTYIETTEITIPQCTETYINGFSDIVFTGSWSVRLKSGGHHTSHVHPMGTLSSAFYVALPKEVEESINNQGYFALGKPNVKTHITLDAQKVIKPVVGKLILFPSYMWHSTLPFESAEFRTTVAFDVKFSHSE